MAAKTAIIVEDYQNWLKQHELTLAELGFKTEGAKSYAEAVGLLRRQRFDVAVIDLCLANDYEVTNLDGVFLLEHLVAKDTQVIIVTDHAHRKLVKEIYQDFGVFEIMEKSVFDRDIFKHYVAQATESQPQQPDGLRKKKRIPQEKIEKLVLEILDEMQASLLQQKRNPVPLSTQSIIVHQKPLRLFISHSSKDIAFTERLVADLRAGGCEFWYDAEQIHVGDTIIEMIARGVSKCDYMIAILSPDAVASDWVSRELWMFANEEIERKRTVILPVLCADCVKPTIMNGRHFADFRTNYEAGFAELRKALGL